MLVKEGIESIIAHDGSDQPSQPLEIELIPMEWSQYIDEQEPNMDRAIFTWLFEAEDGGTKLTLVVLEEDLAWWQSMLESVSALVMSKNLPSMLAAIKTGMENHASPAA